mmetsp:Transcript_35254/g.87566  ORF Transcript_35254/g.87566 Transcript_35254/m.87566 type:complete len:228 (+) Transcript_35254:348-1031(+)
MLSRHDTSPLSVIRLTSRLPNFNAASLAVWLQNRRSASVAASMVACVCWWTAPLRMGERCGKMADSSRGVMKPKSDTWWSSAKPSGALCVFGFLFGGVVVSREGGRPVRKSGNQPQESGRLSRVSSGRTIRPSVHPELCRSWMRTLVPSASESCCPPPPSAVHSSAIVTSTAGTSTSNLSRQPATSVMCTLVPLLVSSGLRSTTAVTHLCLPSLLVFDTISTRVPSR